MTKENNFLISISQDKGPDTILTQCLLLLNTDAILELRKSSLQSFIRSGKIPKSILLKILATAMKILYLFKDHLEQVNHSLCLALFEETLVGNLKLIFMGLSTAISIAFMSKIDTAEMERFYKKLDAASGATILPHSHNLTFQKSEVDKRVTMLKPLD